MEDLVKQFGLPVALSIFFIYQYIASNKEHKDDLKGIAQTAVTAIDKSTDAIDRNSDALIKATQTIDRSSYQLDRLERNAGEAK